MIIFKFLLIIKHWNECKTVSVKKGDLFSKCLIKLRSTVTLMNITYHPDPLNLTYACRLSLWMRRICIKGGWLIKISTLSKINQYHGDIRASLLWFIESQLLHLNLFTSAHSITPTKQSRVFQAIFRSPLFCHLIIRLHVSFNYGDIVNLMIHGGLDIQFFRFSHAGRFLPLLRCGHGDFIKGSIWVGYCMCNYIH